MRWPLIVVVAAIAAGCSGSSQPTRQPAPLPATKAADAPSTKTPAPVPTTAIGRTEFTNDERFCAEPPATGHVFYVVNAGTVTLRVKVSGLPPDADLGVGWHNAHSARGYVIASFRTDHRGRANRSSLRMFRGGEMRGSGLVFATSSDAVKARLRPCEGPR